MAIITYSISIGSATFKTGDKVLLSDLEVHHSLDIPVSYARVVFNNLKDLSATAGDSVIIETGSTETSTKVFTGIVKSIEYSMEAISVVAVSASEKLTRSYSNKVYESSGCGEIVKDLISLSDVKAGKVDTGISFPMYVVVANKNAFQHIKLLAKYCGADVYTDSEDTINFAQYKADNKNKFTFGKDILSIEKEEFAETIDGVLVFGESPAGQGQSEEANFWLKKEEVSGSAGQSSGVVKRLNVFAAKNKDLCDTIASNIFNCSQLKGRGRAIVLNGESAGLGSSVTFSGIPGGKADGTFKITSVKHRLNKDSGLVTELLWEELA